jgi:hypothetical protein
MSTNETATIQAFPERDGIFLPQGWKRDSSEILYIYSAGLFSTQNTISLDLFDVGARKLTFLLTFHENQMMDNIVPWPSSVTGVQFQTIRQAAWNPVYTQWMVVQIEGLTDVGEEKQEALPTILFNYQMNTMLSLDKALNDAVDTTPIAWSEDGKHLILNTMHRGSTVLRFDNLNVDSNFSITDSAKSFPQTILKWFGAGDLLLAGEQDSTSGDYILYVGNIAHGKWYSREFIRFHPSDFAQIREGDWHIAATEQEKQALVALFQ